jgi:hypothetical protein
VSVTRPTAPTVARPGVLRALIIIAHVTSLMILAQAWLAGRIIFIDRHPYLGIHLHLGEATVAMALAQLVCAVAAGIPEPLRRAVVGVNALLFLLIAAQFGLGKAGGSEEIAWHIFNGVLVFGLAAAAVSLALRVRGPHGGE